MFPRPETPGSWQVMWRTEKGRRYRTFPSLAEANYYASELQRERRTNGARVAHGLMSPEDLKAWTEFREATGHAPLSDLLAAWKDRQTFLSGLPISELVTKFLAMRQAEGVSKSNCTNDAKRLGRFVTFIGKDKPGNSITPPEVRAWLENLKKEDLGPKSINHHLRALSMALGRGVAEGWVLKNPCSAVQGPKVEVKEVSVLSLADAIKLFKVNKGSRVAVYMALEAFGGLRFSSAFRISRDEINLEEKTIYTVVSGKNPFPDVANQRNIPRYAMAQTILGQMTDQFTADMIMRATNPDYYSPRSSWDWASQLVLQVRRRDPEQWAYYYIRDKATQWKQAKTGISREQGGYDSPDAEALRNFRRSIYAGDVDAAKRLYLRLLAYGYTAQRFEQGIKSSEPLAELSAKDGSRKAFLDALSHYDRRMLDKAERYSERMSSLKLDARRIFPMEIKGFQTATRKMIEQFKANPRTELLPEMIGSGK